MIQRVNLIKTNEKISILGDFSELINIKIIIIIIINVLNQAILGFIAN